MGKTAYRIQSTARPPSTTALSFASMSTTASNNTGNGNEKDEVSDLVSGILKGDRLALSRGITLIESSRTDHRQLSYRLITTLLKARTATATSTGASSASTVPAAAVMDGSRHVTFDRPPSMRIGVSGPPGVGKSTFIEAFGMYLVGLGHRVAVLSIDPSSQRSGGSILGDKTRMVQLSRQDTAFVRPSPSRGTLGGVAAGMYSPY